MNSQAYQLENALQIQQNKVAKTLKKMTGNDNEKLKTCKTKNEKKKRINVKVC